MKLQKANKHSWLYQVWIALDGYRETCIPNGIEDYYDEEWDEITTAMAWIEEELGIQYDHNLQGAVMNNFDRYLSDINSEMLQDIAKKRRIKNTIMDVLGGFILFLILGIISYYVLNISI